MELYIEDKNNPLKPIRDYYDNETKTFRLPVFLNKKLEEIPKETEIIMFNDSFFGKIDNLSQNLIALFFGWGFNKKVHNLPKNITHIKFGFNFNQKVNKLPKNITHLSLDWSFNQQVDNLPKNIVYLTFDHLFDQKVNNLPKNLTYLKFGCSFNQSLTNLSNKLMFLELSWYFKSEIIFPKNLKELCLTCNNNLINNIPEQIEKLHILFDCEDDKNNKKIENLPLTIKEIIIYDEKYIKYIKVPFNCILSVK